MLIQNVKAKIVNVQPLHATAKNASHRIGYVGEIVTLDVDTNMTFKRQDNEGNDSYTRTSKVDEILIRENWIGVETKNHRYLMERL